MRKENPAGFPMSPACIRTSDISQVPFLPEARLAVHQSAFSLPCGSSPSPKPEKRVERRAPLLVGGSVMGPKGCVNHAFERPGGEYDVCRQKGQFGKDAQKRTHDETPTMPDLRPVGLRDRGNASQMVSSERFQRGERSSPRLRQPLRLPDLRE